jgi:hypothetical protein
MDPITLALIGASIAGGIMQSAGQKTPKSIDPEWLKKHFGADAVNEEMISLFNNIINSPYGQQLLTSAAESGQQFETDVARRSAAAGMGPAGGADSGASIFSGAAAGQAGAGMKRQVKSDVMQQSMQQAQQIVSQRMQAAVNSEMQRMAAENAQPSTMQAIGGGIARGAAAGLAATPRPATPTGMTTPRGGGAPGGLEIPGTPPPAFSAADIAAAQRDAMTTMGRSPWASRLRSRFAGRQPQLVTHGTSRV